MADDSEHKALEQLIELFVYAPVGMIYEYPEVLPKLIRRGKSQVQLAKVLGQMAANQGRQGGRSSAHTPADHSLSAVVGSAAVTLARSITEFTELVGLAPPTPQTPTPQKKPPEFAPRKAGSSEEPEKAASPFPIADYDNLSAKAVIAALADLTPSQRARIRRHEEAHKQRKTVLAKLTRLADA